MLVFQILCIVLFFALMIGVGVVCRKRATDVNGFVLGGRAVGPWLTAFAFGTSYFSAVIFVGYAGQFGWNFGLASTWIGLGNAFIGSLLAWVILGRRTRLMTQKLDSRTMPDFFEKRYGSRLLKTVASVIVFVFLIPYTASLYNGLSSLFNSAFSVPYWAVILVMAVFTGVYVIWGGYIATAVNDFIQGIVMLFGIVAVIVAVLADNGGLGAAIRDLSLIPSEYPDSLGQAGAFSSFFGAQPMYLLIVVLLTSLGTWGLPQMVGKFYSIKNEDAIKKGTVISTVFALIVAGGCYFIGGFGRLYADELAPLFSEAGGVVYDAIIPTMIGKLPGVIVTVVLVLVLAASMSTLSSLVLTSSATLTLDVIVPLRKKGMSEKGRLLTMRLFIVFFIAVSAAIAIVKDAFPTFTFIAQMMGVSWGALAGAFLAPFLYGLYWKKTTPAAVGAAFVFGVGLEAAQLVLMFTGVALPENIIGFVFKNPLYSGVVAMLGGLVIVPIISLFSQKQLRGKEEQVEDAFSCYEEKRLTSATDSLGN